MDQLAEGMLENKSPSNLLQGMKIGVERARRQGAAVCTEGCIRRAVHLLDPQPREVPLPGWWALASEEKTVFLQRKPLRCLMLPPTLNW